MDCFREETGEMEKKQGVNLVNMQKRSETESLLIWPQLLTTSFICYCKGNVSVVLLLGRKLNNTRVHTFWTFCPIISMCCNLHLLPIFKSVGCLISTQGYTVTWCSGYIKIVYCIEIHNSTRCIPRDRSVSIIVIFIDFSNIKSSGSI